MQHQFPRPYLPADHDHFGQKFDIGHAGAVVQHRNIERAGERKVARPDFQTGLVGLTFGVKCLLPNLSHGSAAADTDFDIFDSRLHGPGHLVGTHAAGRTAHTETLGR